MTVYYVDDGGSNTSPYDTWAKAAPNLKTLDTAVALAAGDIIYIGHNSIDSTAAGATTLTMATADPPVRIISATQGSDPVAFQAGSANQIANNSTINFDGAVVLNGLKIVTAGNYGLSNDANETGEMRDCSVALGANGYFGGSGEQQPRRFVNLTIDLSADGTSQRTGEVVDASAGNYTVDIAGLSFVNAGYRSAVVFSDAIGGRISGADFSGFTYSTTCEIVAPGALPINLEYCKTAETWTPMTTARPAQDGGLVTFVNVGPADSPTSLIRRNYNGDLIASAAIYRTGGAAPEGVSTAWLITTESTCTEVAPLVLPWLYGTVEAGSKTFTVHITNDTADLTDAEAWLEVEYLGTSDSPMSTIASDRRANLIATAAAQTDDTTSTWNGTGPSFTYKQKLAVTATVGEAGLYRARVVVGKASIASSAYFYVDPKVIVS
jgi:hypothetical protein